MCAHQIYNEHLWVNEHMTAFYFPAETYFTLLVERVLSNELYSNFKYKWRISIKIKQDWANTKLKMKIAQIHYQRNETD